MNAEDSNASTGASETRRVLTGTMAIRFGTIPIVPLPQDDEPLLGWVRDVAEILKDKGMYRRDKVVMVPYEEARRLEIMDPKAFCSWIQRHLMGYKIKHDENGEPFDAYKDIPTEVAEKTLLSYDFFPSMPLIEEVLPAPMPRLDDDGNLNLMPVGFHEPSGTYIFNLV